MELLLNLAWLLLALPAYWLWRGRTAMRKISALQCLLALGCLLVILFPVISASDDLRAMRAEMEESPGSRKNLRQAASDRAQASHGTTAMVAIQNSGFIVEVSWLQLPAADFLISSQTQIATSSRAPPVSFL